MSERATVTYEREGRHMEWGILASEEEGRELEERVRQAVEAVRGKAGL